MSSEDFLSDVVDVFSCSFIMILHHPLMLYDGIRQPSMLCDSVRCCACVFLMVLFCSVMNVE